LDLGGTGEDLGRGRSVHEQPGTKVDRIASCQRRVSKYVKGNRREVNREPARGVEKGELRYNLYSQSVCVYIIIA
jgi:hypothetical protein